MADIKENTKVAAAESTSDTYNKVEAAQPSAVEKAAVAPAPEKANGPGSTVAVERTPDPQVDIHASNDRDIALAHVEQDRRLSFIKAWEESEKTKAQNKAQKKLSALDAWESSKKASVEAKLKEIEQELEKKKAEYREKMKNMVSLIHKQAEETRATVQAKRGEYILKVEENAAKYRATGYTPKKMLSCISF